MLGGASRVGLLAKSHSSLWPRMLSVPTLATSLVRLVRYKQPSRPPLLFQSARPDLSRSYSSRPTTGCFRSFPLGLWFLDRGVRVVCEQSR